MSVSAVIRNVRLLSLSGRTRPLLEPISSSTGSTIQRGNFPCSPFLLGQTRWKTEDRRILIKSMPLMDMGTSGEKQLDVDLIHTSKEESAYPDENTPNQLFDGVKFSDLPVCHIKTSKNNTLMHFTDPKGRHIVFRSCGLEGFKNTRKGTNIAAQTTAISIAAMAKNKGVNNCRVIIQGLGPGRMSAVKGLQMAGIKIVCVADCTPISFHPDARPRKARRL